jgi:predicted dienelactone hydrolase
MRRALGLVLLLAACAPAAEKATPSSLPFAPAGPSDSPEPSKLGPYPVGVRTVTFIDQTRMTPGRTTPRKLVCEVWYPAVESARGGTEAYVLHDYLPDSLKDVITVESLGTITTTARRDAEATHEGGPFPFILFSHGKGGIRMQSTFYTVTLASHGYVVLAPDHEGDTLPELLEMMRIDPVSTLDAYVDRQADESFLLNQWTALSPSDPLYGITDMNRVGLTGHSFGALTSLKVAGLDARARAVVAQCPAGYAITQADVPTPLEQYEIPVMLQGGDLDRTLPPDPHATSVYEHLVKPRYLMRLKHGGHFTYSDLCVLDVAAIDAVLPLDISNVLTDGCGMENTPTSAAFPVINRAAVGFFNRYLRNSPGSQAFLTEPKLLELAPGEVTFQVDP